MAKAFLKTGANLFPDLDQKDALPREFAWLITAKAARERMETQGV